ncbi:ATP synthase F1 subunit delta [Botryobacter ruber]|uniref:ATP synthase F1 subunit delta n=1 Tax=Botryobacter ruber TaxID=2171629 RepID=UPI000E0AB7ED|nr:ATP synthase F1 subunit delta [Botryobacter ruber]
MSNIRVASRYAKSLIELASEKGVLEQVQEDMLLFSQVVSQNRDFQLLLQNPIVKSNKKLAIIKSVFGQKVSSLTMAFFDIVARKNREPLLEAAAKEFGNQYNVLKGIQVATVTSAMPLTPALRNQITAQVAAQTGKKVTLVEKVDPALIGGFILRVGDQQVDSSVRYNLIKLSNKFKDNPYINKL